MSTPISLAEFIHQVKQDLLDEQFRQEGAAPLLAIREVEIEASVVATREGGGGARGGLKLSVPGLGEVGAETGVEGKLGRADTQTVRVRLAPFLDVEQLLAQMSPEELEKVQKQAKEHIARGGGGTRGRDRA